MSITPADERENVNEVPSQPSALNDLPREQLQRSGRYLPPPPQMSPPPPMRHTLPPVAPRQRAAIACLNCRKRKVRCCGRDASDSSRCTTCARTSRPCIFVAVRNEAFAPPYALDNPPRRDQSRALRSPSWQRRETYPYPHLRQHVVRDDKLWMQRPSGAGEWRGTEDLFHRPEQHEPFRPAPHFSQPAERSKLLMDRTSYNSDLPLANLPRASSVYQSSVHDSYIHGPWIGAHTFQGYAQHHQLPPAPMPASFLPSVPSLSVAPPGPYPGPFNSSWQQMKMESPIKSA